MAVVVKKRNNFGAYGLAGMAAVYLVYAVAYVLGVVKPLQQFESVITGLGFVSLALILSLVLLSLGILSKLGRRKLEQRLGLALVKVFFAVLSEGLLVLALFGLVALFVSLTKTGLDNGFLFPVSYFLLSVWNKALVWIMVKRKKAVLLLFAIALISLFSVFVVSVQIIPLVLFILFLSPIIFKVFTVNIPGELQGKFGPKKV